MAVLIPPCLEWGVAADDPPGEAQTFRTKLLYGSLGSTALSQQGNLFSSFQAQFSSVLVHGREGTASETSLKYHSKLNEGTASLKETAKLHLFAGWWHVSGHH